LISDVDDSEIAVVFWNDLVGKLSDSVIILVEVVVIGIVLSRFA
jgi:hypothetical protein